METFGSTTPDLIALRDWLKGLDITHVAMEATGVYWKCVYYLLEDDFELMLLNAQHVKHVPGRKTDTINACWIAQLLAHGLLRGSFVPPKPIRRLRDLTRYRKALVEERSRAVDRLHKVLEDAGVKLACVATDIIMGVSSGRAMMHALIAGEADPRALLLAELAKGRLRAKLPEMRKESTRGPLLLRPPRLPAGTDDARPHRGSGVRHRGDLRPDRGGNRPFRGGG